MTPRVREEIAKARAANPGPSKFQIEEERFLDRLWARVELAPSGCWLWTGTTVKPDGYGIYQYGVVTRGGKRRGAHRVVYELMRGPIPYKLLVQRCNTELCVNPYHWESRNHWQEGGK